MSVWVMTGRSLSTVREGPVRGGAAFVSAAPAAGARAAGAAAAAAGAGTAALPVEEASAAGAGATLSGCGGAPFCGWSVFCPEGSCAAGGCRAAEKGAADEMKRKETRATLPKPTERRALIKTLLTVLAGRTGKGRPRRLGLR